MQAIMIAFIVLFCLCAVSLIFTDNRQGSRFMNEISKKRKKLQSGTFVCFHCRERKPIGELSTAIHRMCKACEDWYEKVSDER